ncbi:MAG TPA: hypothetical protein DCE43_04885, partial [Planctomycetaceae bacterium]|nr:hypothetical protein [Planctomycetaceae bacterium]
KVLGQYDRIIGLISDVVHGQATSESLLILAVFASGCLVGLIGFSKLLRWLLANFRETTLAVLCGAMCGSLRVLWPFGNRGPEGGMIPAVLLAAGFVVVLVLDRLASRNEPGHSEDREE